MDIFIYSDESGVFDKEHNDIFVYGGLILLGKEQKDSYSRKYKSIEDNIRSNKYPKNFELKAYKISNKEKTKLYHAINGAIRFGIIIHQKKILDRIFQSKKDKQRYLDYAYKVGVKKTFQKLIKDNIINKDDIDTIHFYNDEHSTATNGRYELKESLEKELKNGTYNEGYNIFYPPIFENMKGVSLDICDSKKVILIRAADIIANKIYYKTNTNSLNDLKNIYFTELP